MNSVPPVIPGGGGSSKQGGTMSSRQTPLHPIVPALLAAALFTGSFGAAAQTATWGSRGPLGGNVYCIVADPAHPTTLYAGTALGVFVSSDAGATWSRPAGGTPPGRVQTIAVDPTNSLVLYAGTLTPNGVASIGIYKSTDGGASWTSISDGLIDPFTGIAPLDVAALAIDPHSPTTLIAGTRFSEIFKSTDGGTTWYPVTAGGYSISLQVTAVQFDPSNSKTVYAASTAGFLKSTDGGESWSNFGNAGVSFSTLVLDPSNPSTLYAGNQTGSGIYKSTDGGSHWSSARVGLPAPPSPFSGSFALINALALDGASSSTVYAATYGNGVFVSRDSGASWTSASNGLRDTVVLSIASPPGSGAVYAGTLGDGVYRSADQARTWTSSSAGMIASVVYALLADPTAAGTVYAGTSDGVRKTTDGGATWQLSVNGISNVPAVDLAASTGSLPTLFAATLGAGLRRSVDGGASWTAVGSSLNDSYVSSITVDPTSANTLYAGTSHPYDGTNPQRLYKSTDGGTTWTQTSLNAGGFSVDFEAVNPARAAEIFAGSIGVVGLFHSTNAGQAWTTIATDAQCGGVNALLYSPSGATLYLAGTRGVCRSTDGGTTWTLATLGSGLSARTLVADPANPSVMYAGTDADPDTLEGGVFQSTDAGANWTSIGTATPGAMVTSLALSGGALHAGTYGAGVEERIPSAPRTRPGLPTVTHGPPRPVRSR
jgi:hypothetical protein